MVSVIGELRTNLGPRPSPDKRLLDSRWLDPC